MLTIYMYYTYGRVQAWIETLHPSQMGAPVFKYLRRKGLSALCEMPNSNWGDELAREYNGNGHYFEYSTGEGLRYSGVCLYVKCWVLLIPQKLPSSEDIATIHRCILKPRSHARSEDSSDSSSSSLRAMIKCHVCKFEYVTYKRYHKHLIDLTCTRRKLVRMFYHYKQSWNILVSCEANLDTIAPLAGSKFLQFHKEGNSLGYQPRWAIFSQVVWIGFIWPELLPLSLDEFVPITVRRERRHNGPNRAMKNRSQHYPIPHLLSCPTRGSLWRLHLHRLPRPLPEVMNPRRPVCSSRYCSRRP